jgi:hypothetical protein
MVNDLLISLAGSGGDGVVSAGKCLIGTAVAMLLAIVPFSTTADGDDASALIREAYIKLEEATSVEIQQSEEQTSSVMSDGKPLGTPQSTTQTSTIEMDNRHGIVRLATNAPTLGEVVILRSHDRVAMKTGSGDWGPLEGPFAAMGKQLANPMACPVYKENEKPTWRTAGESTLDGKEIILLETVGDSALAYVQRVQEEGLASVFPDAETRPKISIVSYSMRAWVAKTGGTLLRQEKTLKGRLALPDTGEVEFTTHGVQNYRRYGEVELTIPEAAKQILAPEPDKKKEGS